MSRKRKLKKSIFIVCEGKNTEPNYFSRLKEEVEESSSDYAVDVYVHQTAKTHATGLIEEAQQYAREYDEVWAVFDKDGYTKHQEAFQLANKRGKKVQIAFSSIAFEHWVLLHFERNMNDFEKASDIIDYLKDKHYFDGYSKKSNADIYPMLRRKTLTAIENSAWLRWQMQKKQNGHQGEIFQTNPITTVDALVGKLIAYRREIVWGGLQEGGRLHGLSFSFASSRFEIPELNISLKITNENENSYLLDPENGDIYLIDTQSRKEFKPLNLQKVLIPPSSHLELDLSFFLSEKSKLQNMVFNVNVRKSRWLCALG